MGTIGTIERSLLLPQLQLLSAGLRGVVTQEAAPGLTEKVRALSPLHAAAIAEDLVFPLRLPVDPALKTACLKALLKTSSTLVTFLLAAELQNKELPLRGRVVGRVQGEVTRELKEVLSAAKNDPKHFHEICAQLAALDIRRAVLFALNKIFSHSRLQEVTLPEELEAECPYTAAAARMLTTLADLNPEATCQALSEYASRRMSAEMRYAIYDFVSTLSPRAGLDFLYTLVCKGGRKARHFAQQKLQQIGSQQHKVPEEYFEYPLLPGVSAAAKVVWFDLMGGLPDCEQAYSTMIRLIEAPEVEVRNTTLSVLMIHAERLDEVHAVLLLEELQKAESLKTARREIIIQGILTICSKISRTAHGPVITAYAREYLRTENREGLHIAALQALAEHGATEDIPFVEKYLQLNTKPYLEDLAQYALRKIHSRYTP